ncbi:MAG: dehydratase, partial [Gordonia sp. (in: high G+C Gram-positive bacteria)]
MSDTPKTITQRGLWFDEMEVGAVYKHAPGRTIT